MIGVLSAEPIAEAQVTTVAEAVPGYAVANTAVLDRPSPSDLTGPTPSPLGEGILSILSPSKDEGWGEGDPSPSPIADEEPNTPSPLAGEGRGEGEYIAPHKNGKLKTVIECMLFVASEPVSVKSLAETLDIEESRVEGAIASLQEDLNCGHGLQLVKVAGGFQLCTRPEYADYCAMVVAGSKKKLSKAALETLAVIAYRQPCTMPEIEAVRGVAVDGVVKTLLDRGLIKEAGRKKTPGRPILYATTPEFLEYFGLADISELPDIDMLAVEEVKALEAERETLTGEVGG